MIPHTFGIRCGTHERETFIVRVEDSDCCWLCEHENYWAHNKKHRDADREQSSRFSGEWVRRKGWKGTVYWFPYECVRPILGQELAQKLKSRMHTATLRYDYDDLPCLAGVMAIEHLGCTVSELMERFENQMQTGMSWSNFGLGGWQIDHIQPISRFDLRDIDQVKIVCHADNLRPCWAQENMRKGSKLLQSLGTAKQTT